MNRRFAIIAATLAAGLFIGEGSAHAHLRDYLFNQGYYTSRKGEFELEFHNDFKMPETDDDDTYNLKQQYELEYGVTDHLQLAVYDVVTWNRTDNWEQDSYKIEGKYRFLEAGELPVDITLYGEYIDPNGSRDVSSDTVELKLILGKNMGDWNVTGNFIAEREINQHEPWVLEYTLGARYPVTPRLHLGLELKGGLGDSAEFGLRRKDNEFQIMPIIGFSPTPKSRILFGPAIGMTRASDDLQLKTIASIEF